MSVKMKNRHAGSDIDLDTLSVQCHETLVDSF